MLRTRLGLLAALSGTDDDNRVHVDSEDRPEAARKLADALEKIMRDGSDAAPDADLCTGCILMTVADATRLLFERYAPGPASTVTDDVLLSLLSSLSRRRDGAH